MEIKTVNMTQTNSEMVTTQHDTQPDTQPERPDIHQVKMELDVDDHRTPVHPSETTQPMDKTSQPMDKTSQPMEMKREPSDVDSNDIVRKVKKERISRKTLNRKTKIAKVKHKRSVRKTDKTVVDIKPDPRPQSPVPIMEDEGDDVEIIEAEEESLEEPLEPVPVVESGPYVCDICERTIGSGSQMQRHLQTHQNERNYRCDQCERTYKSSSSLAGHLKVCHSGVRPYVCQTCQKTFPRLNSLNRHNMTHTGEKPFACTVCDKRFPQNSYLKAHMRNHTGEKPFRCEDCGDRFKHSGYLIDHRRRIHTGEKRHECGTCGKLFTRASDRLRHERTHDAPKPDAKRRYKCQQCGVRFKFRTRLDEHIQEKCKNGRENQQKPAIVKLDTSPKQTRKQLKPRRAGVKEDEGLSDGSERRWSKEEVAEETLSRITAPLVFFEDDPPRRRTRSEQYRCESCGDRFPGWAALIDHAKLHRKPFKCLTCNEAFSWSLDLVKHARQHAHRGEQYEYQIYRKRYKSDHPQI